MDRFNIYCNYSWGICYVEIQPSVIVSGVRKEIVEYGDNNS